MYIQRRELGTSETNQDLSYQAEALYIQLHKVKTLLVTYHSIKHFYCLFMILCKTGYHFRTYIYIYIYIYLDNSI
jgi:hypothetical protein